MSSTEAETSVYDGIIEALTENDYAIVDGLLPEPLLAALDAHFASLGEARFKPAGVGRADRFQTDSTIRNDVIHWLEQGEVQSVDDYFAWMEGLRRRVNQRFFLGLFDFECHYARFAQGRYYKRHVDAFRGQANRRLTVILYLNRDWTAEDGGLLRMYEEDDAVQPFAEVLPVYGRMVIFFSEMFPHEVMPANRTRRSVTGWFRVNNSSSQWVDPSG